MFTTRVERSIMAAHHNGPPESKCHRNHGHSFGIVVQVPVPDEKLNAYGWTVDFSIIKAVIDRYDHQDLNLLMDEAPSAENLAVRLYREIAKETGYTPEFVEVEEGHGNTVRYTA